MTDTAADSPTPKQATAVKHSIPVIVSLLVLLLAAVAFGGAVVMSGGVNEALNLVGLGTPSTKAELTSTQIPRKPAGSKPTAPASGATTSSTDPAAAATSTPAATTGSSAAAVKAAATTTKPKPSRNPGLPSAARAAMYREQVQSQAAIAKLVNNNIASLTLGTPRKSTSSAQVPVTVAMRDGSAISGTMSFRKYNGLWYFFSLTASGGGSTAYPGAVSSSVVAIITREQATKANQAMITNGVLGGGFKTATVTGVSKGAGTATVNVKLSGGTAAAKNGQFVCISQTDGPTTYWFLTRFAAK